MLAKKRQYQWIYTDTRMKTAFSHVMRDEEGYVQSYMSSLNSRKYEKKESFLKLCKRINTRIRWERKAQHRKDGA